MTMNQIFRRVIRSVMGSSYYRYFKACYFAGRFYRAFGPCLSGT